jgi:glutaredoxin
MVNNRPYLLLLEENRFFLYSNNMTKSLKKYSLKTIILKDCPWSNALNELLKIKKIKSKIIIVDSNTKNKYKTDIINTFPQFYLVDKKNNLIKDYLIGGYDVTKRLLDIINENKPNIDIIKSKFKEILPHFNNKLILKLIILLA